MKLKRNKIDVEAEIYSVAYGSAINIINTELGYGQLAQVISRAIAAATQHSVRTLLDNMYSNEDFERDMNLRP